MTKNNYYIIADHIRTIAFCVADGVQPSAKGRGYVLRRLIRRSLSASKRLKIDILNTQYYQELVESVIGIYDGVYPELLESKDVIIQTLATESTKFQKSISTGEKEWTKILKKKDETTNFTLIAWNLYQTFGVPFEVSIDILGANGIEIDDQELEALITAHQKNSQTTSAGMFKSGLGENNAKTTALHTVTHILHRVLIEVLDPSFAFGFENNSDNLSDNSTVKQMGSAITSEKARFDFSFDRKIEDNELELIETKVRDLIQSNLKMSKVEVTPLQAREMGAIGLFGEKYGDLVTVYSLVNIDGKVVSREFCGGPHIESTDDITKVGKFTILKEKSVSSGVRRIEFDLV